MSGQHSAEGTLFHIFSLIVSKMHDPVFGPVILFGHGGTAVEVVADQGVAHAVDGTDEAHHEFVRGLLVQLPRLAHLLDLAVVHDDDVLTEVDQFEPAKMPAVYTAATVWAAMASASPVSTGARPAKPWLRKE